VAGLEVRLFGDISIQRDGRSLSFPSGKALELFCYLLLHRDSVHTREMLSEVLWPDAKPAVSKTYLRQTIWRLSGALRSGQDRRGAETGPVLSVEPGWVRLDSDSSWWLDVSAFERAYAETRDTSGHHLSDHQAQELETALELYRGDLLATWYHDWCGYERDRLQLTYLAMLDQLMGHCEARRRYSKGLSLGQVVLRHDPARERTHRQLMRLHYRAGDRISAIRQYERCAAVIAREFGVQPSAGTAVLYEQIRADRVPDVPVSPAAEQPVAERRDTAEIAGLHMRLDQIQASLTALQESVLQNRGTFFDYIRNGAPEKFAGSMRTGRPERGS
jgi:DNA-binding SARP family transcriptional activator